MLNQVETRDEKQRPVTYTMPSENIRFSRCYKQVYSNGNSLSRCRVIWKGEFVGVIHKHSTSKVWGIMYVNEQPAKEEFRTLTAAKAWLKNETRKVKFMDELDRLANKVGFRFERTGVEEYDIFYDGKEVGFVYQPSYEDCRVCLSITNPEFIKMMPEQKDVFTLDYIWRTKEFLIEYIH